MLKTLYVANPYGFSAQQKAGPLVALVDALTAAGAEVWEPFARNNQIDRTTAGWAYQVSQADLRDVRDADGLFAVVNGCPPDEGVMVELGMAIAWHKPTFLFRDDFRRCTDSEVYPLNLKAAPPHHGSDRFTDTATDGVGRLRAELRSISTCPRVDRRAPFSSLLHPRSRGALPPGPRALDGVAGRLRRRSGGRHARGHSRRRRTHAAQRLDAAGRRIAAPAPTLSASLAPLPPPRCAPEVPGAIPVTVAPTPELDDLLQHSRDDASVPG